jgi:serine/threonine-protein kinase
LRSAAWELPGAAVDRAVSLAAWDRLPAMSILRRIVRFFAGLIQFSLYSALFFALMVAAGYGVALQFFGGEEVTVPDLTGVSAVEALERLQPAHIGLQLERRQPHVQVPKDHIISQYPRPGVTVKAGTPIRVVVSEGLPLVTVPDLRGSNKIEAGIRLRKLGLNVGNTTSIPRAGIPGGTVLTTDPPGGTGVIEGVAVNLLLAAGEQSRVRLMPNLIGLTADEGREVLTSYGLELDQVREREAFDVPVGQIHSQNPPPGESLGPVTRIEVTVQPERTDEPPPGVNSASLDEFFGQTPDAGEDRQQMQPATPPALPDTDGAEPAMEPTAEETPVAPAVRLDF